MGQRKAVTKANATRFRRASKADKGKILDELCQTTGWHRNQARRALVAALRPTPPPPRRARTPDYGPEVLVVARIVTLVEQASATKAKAQLFVERIEQRYSVTVVLTTLLVFAVPLTLGASLRPTLLRAMTYMIVASAAPIRTRRRQCFVFRFLRRTLLNQQMPFNPD